MAYNDTKFWSQVDGIGYDADPSGAYRDSVNPGVDAGRKLYFAGSTSGKEYVAAEAVAGTGTATIPSLGTLGTGKFNLTLNVNNTPVTVNGAVATDQSLMSFSVVAGGLNLLNREIEIDAAGTLNTVAATAVTAIVFKVKLGSITLATFTSTAPAASQVNTPWNFRLLAGVTTAGASGALEGHGNLSIRLAAGAGVNSIFSDVITAPVSAVDLTAAQTLLTTVALTGNAVTTNNVTQRKMVTRLLN